MQMEQLIEIRKAGGEIKKENCPFKCLIQICVIWLVNPVISHLNLDFYSLLTKNKMFKVIFAAQLADIKTKHKVFSVHMWSTDY